MFDLLTRRRAGSFLAVAACSLALGACGDDEASTESSGSSSSSSGSSTEGSTSNDQDSAQVRLQECLRENGVDLPAAGDGAPDPGAIDQEALETAMEACEEFQQEAFGAAGVDEEELQDQFTVFSQCMRDEGVDVPDVDFGEGPPAGGNELDPDDPDVQAALEKCQDELPQGSLGGGGTP